MPQLPDGKIEASDGLEKLSRCAALRSDLGETAPPYFIAHLSVHPER
jgi:hypothetical protein